MSLNWWENRRKEAIICKALSSMCTGVQPAVVREAVAGCQQKRLKMNILGQNDAQIVPVGVTWGGMEASENRRWDLHHGYLF